VLLDLRVFAHFETIQDPSDRPFLPCLFACTTICLLSPSSTPPSTSPSHLCSLLPASPRPSGQRINKPTISTLAPLINPSPSMRQDVFSQLRSLSTSVMACLGMPFWVRIFWRLALRRQVHCTISTPSDLCLPIFSYKPAHTFFILYS